ncbi:MAG: FAD-dependent oxidoreductase, partial [Candidatus Niameybacter stercoravium]|nr:FAD-dependent oxidoreductase [Candidatus Niameybacter stercoravium]
YILPSKTGFRIGTNRGTFEGQLVINAAGVYADEINNSISQKKYHITARKGEYLLLDKKEVSKTTLFQLPTHLGKGVLVTPTCHGNIILGPTALDIDNKTNVETTREQLDAIMEKVSLTIDTRQLSGVITSFSGLRAHEAQNDFVIGEAEDVPGFINVLGIESPGLTSAPAIGKYVAQIVEGKLKPSINLNFNPIREGIRSFKEASEEERKKLVDQDKKYGHIVCRCETITEAEILQAIRGPLGAKTVDGVKRRTRAGMGRCQGGFCMNRIVELLAEELHIELEEVRKNTAGSELLVADLKEGLEE